MINTDDTNTDKSEMTGKIIKGIGGIYTVASGGINYDCHARGLFRYKDETPLPGDMVLFRQDDPCGSLVDILPRKNELIRPRIANCDLSVIVFAWKEPELNLGLLDRLLILSEMNGLTPVICINKSDLGTDASILSVYKKANYIIKSISADNNEGIESLIHMFKDKVTVISGPSGVGKSSLINAILPGAGLETGLLSKKISRGKHTTRMTELLPAYGGYIADTPGFSSLTIQLGAYELASHYPEMKNAKCKFTNCLHITEPECSVRNGLGVLIDEERYERYVKLVQECLDLKSHITF